MHNNCGKVDEKNPFRSCIGTHRAGAFISSAKIEIAAKCAKTTFFCCLFSIILLKSKVQKRQASILWYGWCLYPM